ncbi:MAG TPA: Calx-beta domain-containing protein [Verrucomicrobiae bacterium]
MLHAKANLLQFRCFRALCTLLICGLSAAHADFSLHYYYGRALAERDTSIQVHVFAGESTQEQSVDYNVIGLSAEAGTDFKTNNGTLTFAPGETEKTITIQLIDNNLFESQEEFRVQLSNPTPIQALGTSIIDFTIADDDTGYSIGFIPAVREDSEYAEVKIRRLGDFNFASTVEAFIVADSARPGIDYVDENFLISFPSGISERTVRIHVLNDKVEDGDRALSVKLRNPTGDVPIVADSDRQLVIYDNELGYSVLADLRPSFDTVVNEGGTNQLYLWRQGDYDVSSSVALKTVSPDGMRELATPGADFNGETFQLEFAPGQTHAVIPVTILNDAAAETPEYIVFEHPKTLSDTNARSSAVQIIDNELNPLPVSKVCLDPDPRTGNPFAPGNVIIPVKDGFLMRANSIPLQQPFQLIRLKHDGTLDSEFRPIDLNFMFFTEIQVVETSDSKYVVQLDRTLRRYHNNGELDSTFQPYTVEELRGFGEADGRFYVAGATNVVRLHPNGSIDDTYQGLPPQAFIGIQYMVLQPDGTVYLQGEFGVPGFPAQTNYLRLTASGAVDPSFNPSGLVGMIFGSRSNLFLRGEETIHRVTPTGQLDSSFQPLKVHYFAEKYFLDTNGNFYIPRTTSLGMIIERYTPDGLLDPTFLRGEIDRQLLTLNALSLDGTRLLTHGSNVPTLINGVDLLCYVPPTAYQMGLLHLTPAPRNYISPAIELLERETGTPDIVPVMRTGANADTSATAGYRVRNATATNGVHFTLPAEGEVQFAPGQSRVELPIIVHDNTVAEYSRTFYIDLLDASTNVTATSEIRILNDDVAVEILGIFNNRLRLTITPAEPYLNFDWSVSPDLQNWETGYITSTGATIEIDITGGHRFISGRRTLESTTFAWETPIFSYR